MLDRLKRVLGLSADKEIASLLGVTSATVSGWRTRDSIPIQHFIDLAIARSISLDWLLLGEGPMLRGESSPATATPPGLREALAAEGRAAEAELGLGEVASLARLGTLGGAWRVLWLLTPQGGRTATEIRELLPDVDEDQLRAYLVFLEKIGIVVEEGGTYRRSTIFQVKSLSTFDENQHALEAVRVLMAEVMPALESKQGKLVTIRGRLGAEQARRLLDDLAPEVKRRTRELMELPGDEFGAEVLLAVAVKEG